MEGTERDENAIDETKALLALSDEEMLKKIRKSYKEKQNNNKEMSAEELDNVAGGSTVSTDKIFDWLRDNIEGFNKDYVTPPKYPCPKCGSWNVDNIDIGVFYQMRVRCHDCGHYGVRD